MVGIVIKIFIRINLGKEMELKRRFSPPSEERKRIGGGEGGGPRELSREEVGGNVQVRVSGREGERERPGVYVVAPYIQDQSIKLNRPIIPSIDYPINKT